MSTTALCKIYPEPSICEREIWRYAGCKTADNTLSDLLKDCLQEARDVLTYKVCYTERRCQTDGDLCDFGGMRVHSKHLASALQGCDRVIVFAATVGTGLDRLIAKYSRLSPAKALMLQAIGTERIEALCDAFCADMASIYGMGLTPRFSPGYGDLPLDTQRELFALLNPAKHIGLTLNDSLLMSPSKSVTAFAGIGGKIKSAPNKCSLCQKTDCAFRGVV